MARQAAARILNNDRLILGSALSAVAGADNTIYYYNNALWRKKSANTKILQKSVDHGANWSDIYTFDFTVGIIIVTANGNILVSQDSDDDTFTSPPSELFLSTDGGTTFNSILTLATGGFASWSFDVYQNTVFVGEYGEYNSLHVYRSTDGGATWSTVFTHPVDGSATVHIHKVHIDNIIPTTIYISTGDNTAAKGIWYSTNNGNTWTAISRNLHQPTWMETDDTYLYLGQDLEGTISRIAKSRFAEGNDAIETVYDGPLDPRGTFANLSFYSGAYDADNDIIYFGAVGYGQNHSSNNRDSVLLASIDHGESWAVLKRYSRHPTAASGPAVISKKSDQGLFYVKTNNPAKVETFTSASVLASLQAGLSRSAAIRTSLAGNLIPNPNFEDAPPFTAVQTTPATRWIDGTSGGSSARSSQWRWGIPTGGLTAAVSCQFDDTVLHNGSPSMKLSTTNTLGAISVASYRNTPGTTTVHELFGLLPSTAYVFTAWIKTSNVVTNGSWIDVREYNSVGTLLVTNSTSKLTGTNDWTLVTVNFTTNASTRHGSVLLRLNVPGNVSDAWFANLRLELATLPSRTVV